MILIIIILAIVEFCRIDNVPICRKYTNNRSIIVIKSIEQKNKNIDNCIQQGLYTKKVVKKFYFPFPTKFEYKITNLINESISYSKLNIIKDEKSKENIKEFCFINRKINDQQ